MKRQKIHIPGILCVSIIAFSLFVAVFVYFLAPDSSPHANEMHLELSTLPPGSEVTFIRLNKSQQKSTSFLSRLAFGQKEAFISIPVSSFELKGDVLNYIPYGGIHFKTMHKLKWDPNDDTSISYQRKYRLGTDKYGRDLLSRLMVGTRISLAVGFISVFISLLIGISLGLISGFYGSWIDKLVMWFVHVVWSIPTLLMVIAISLALGKGFWQVFVAVGLCMWVEVARVVRGQVMSVKQKEYILAARVLGFGDFRIMFRHILPNILGPIIVISAANFASAILIEAGLSFLGIGAKAPMPSWGAMIKNHYAYIILDKAYLALAPGLAIMFLVFALMLVGNMLREKLDVRD
jgi:peptide/nickel transport system permease protein